MSLLYVFFFKLRFKISFKKYFNLTKILKFLKTDFTKILILLIRFLRWWLFFFNHSSFKNLKWITKHELYVSYM